MNWFDAHLDLATLAVEGRDLSAPLEEAAGGPQPAAVTFASLREGGVRACLATIFTGPGDGPCRYPAGDVEAAHRAGVEQVEHYRRWGKQGHLQRFDEAMALPEEEPRSVSDDCTGWKPMLRYWILMEGADPIRTPAEVGWWFERGVRIVGLTWALGTRYAGGNANPGPLTDAGRDLIRALDAHGIVHDLSHLADEAAWRLIESTDGPIIASHSNCRALIDGENQRHLSDDLIRTIAQRGGVIGVNLFSAFLCREGWQRRATIAETIAHVEHICDLTGRSDLVGLGSDMDGGFGADRLPQGIDRSADLTLLLEALAQRGWSDDGLRGFAMENWRRFFMRAVPPTGVGGL